MVRSDTQWLAVADEFYNAAVDQGRWYSALAGLAAATGSRTGELITVGTDAAVPINIMTNMDPAIHEAAAVARIGDPNINPRIRVGLRTRVLQVMAECDFLTPEEHAKHPHYDEFARPWDIPYICLATLERRDDLLIGLAVLRSEREGHIESGQREIFATLAPHVRAAVRMQIALDGNGTTLLTGAFDTLAIPAFVCGRTGDVQACTEAAEEIARGARGLTLRNHRLRAARDEEDKALQDAIMNAARGRTRHGAPALETVVIRGTNEANVPLVLDVMALPSLALEFFATSRVLIVVRGSRGADARKAALLQGVYGFTAAETDIALQLAQGKAAEAIAQERRVALGTVRAQIKSLLGKIGVRRQVELVAKLNEF